MRLPAGLQTVASSEGVGQWGTRELVEQEVAVAL